MMNRLYTLAALTAFLTLPMVQPLLAQTPRFETPRAASELEGTSWRQDETYGWELAFLSGGRVEPREYSPGVVTKFDDMSYTIDGAFLTMTGPAPFGQVFEVSCVIRLSANVMRLLACSEREYNGSYRRLD